MSTDISKSDLGINSHYAQSGITSARQMNKIGDALKKLSMSQDLYRSPTGWRYTASTSGVVFSGQARVSGILYTGLNSDTNKPWVKVDLTTSPPTVTEEDGPAPSPFPPGEEWYEKGNTAGTIHIPRF